MFWNIHYVDLVYTVMYNIISIHTCSYITEERRQLKKKKGKLNSKNPKVAKYHYHLLFLCYSYLSPTRDIHQMLDKTPVAQQGLCHP